MLYLPALPGRKYQPAGAISNVRNPTAWLSGPAKLAKQCTAVIAAISLLPGCRGARSRPLKTTSPGAQADTINWKVRARAVSNDFTL
jgi:hypothetical protein